MFHDSCWEEKGKNYVKLIQWEHLSIEFVCNGLYTHCYTFAVSHFLVLILIYILSKKAEVEEVMNKHVCLVLLPLPSLLLSANSFPGTSEYIFTHLKWKDMLDFCIKFRISKIIKSTVSVFGRAIHPGMNGAFLSDEFRNDLLTFESAKAWHF